MYSTASIAVATRADFVVKGTIYLVFLSSKNRSQIIGHLNDDCSDSRVFNIEKHKGLKNTKDVKLCACEKFKSSASTLRIFCTAVVMLTSARNIELAAYICRYGKLIPIKQN